MCFRLIAPPSASYIFHVRAFLVQLNHSDSDDEEAFGGGESSAPVDVQEILISSQSQEAGPAAAD